MHNAQSGLHEKGSWPLHKHNSTSEASSLIHSTCPSVLFLFKKMPCHFTDQFRATSGLQTTHLQEEDMPWLIWKIPKQAMRSK